LLYDSLRTQAVQVKVAGPLINGEGAEAARIRSFVANAGYNYECVGSHATTKGCPTSAKSKVEEPTGRLGVIFENSCPIVLLMASISTTLGSGGEL